MTCPQEASTAAAVPRQPSALLHPATRLCLLSKSVLYSVYAAEQLHPKLRDRRLSAAEAPRPQEGHHTTAAAEAALHS
jgi:hypothetical protein